MADREVVFIDGVRTPFGRMGGSLRSFFASQVATFALKGLIEKTEIAQRGRVSLKGRDSKKY